MLLNVKNQHIYSDKLRLSVVDLTHIELATDEDKLFQIDYWAKLFKASTWEEIKMIAATNEYISEASKTLYQLSNDEKVRLQCEVLEDYNRRELTYQNTLYRKEQLLEQQAAQIAQLQAELAALKKSHS